jgi:CheY-like chemotaxis protein
VPAEVIARVFEPFFTTKGVGEGTGLGLSQVYGFARSSGGDVQIESEVGKGTTVSLVIPRSDKPLPKVVAKATPAATNGSRRCRVLLVEDDHSVAELVGEMLSELGYDTAHAPTAVKALETLRNERTFDLVFSDMVMPGDMSGLDLAREIARRRPDLPIVLTTGYSAAAASATAEGVRLLVKPYRIEALAAELQAALSHPANGMRAH